VCTLLRVEGNMNTEQYISALDDNLWSVIVRHFFQITGGYFRRTMHRVKLRLSIANEWIP
jgi:hypothetical protein